MNMCVFTWHAECVLSIHLLINKAHFHLARNLNPTYNILAINTYLHSMKVQINIPQKINMHESKKYISISYRMLQQTNIEIASSSKSLNFEINDMS
jgi:hypothetical protein